MDNRRYGKGAMVITDCDPILWVLRREPAAERRFRTGALPDLPPGKHPATCPSRSASSADRASPATVAAAGAASCLCHKLMIAAAAPLRGPLTRANNPTVTNYSCRIRVQNDMLLTLPVALVTVTMRAAGADAFIQLLLNAGTSRTRAKLNE